VGSRVSIDTDRNRSTVGSLCTPVFVLLPLSFFLLSLGVAWELLLSMTDTFAFRERFRERDKRPAFPAKYFFPRENVEKNEKGGKRGRAGGGERKNKKIPAPN
jgi:hypothetical protein